MKEHYVSFEQGQALKRLGFKEEVTHYYTPEDAPKGKAWFTFSFTPCDHNHQPPKGVIPKCSAPRLDQAQAWLREVKGWHIQVRINGVRSAYWYEIWSTTPNGPVYGTPGDDTFRRGQYESYEQALSAGLDAAIELLGKEEK